MCQMSSIDFPAWLQEEINKRDWRPTDLAKRARISDAAVSRILRGERKADTDTLLAFSEVFSISPITIFRKAGLLPDTGGEKITKDDWEHMLQQLTPEEQDEIYSIMDMKIKRRQQAEASARAANFKPGKVKK